MMRVGLGGYVNYNRVTVIVPFGSNPISKEVQDARDSNRLIDCTHGRRTRSVIFMDSGQVVLSSVTPEKLEPRWDEEHYRMPREPLRGEGTDG
jgi:regulator of extracellular matrix RemA (YlzA/DUF370 family)